MTGKFCPECGAETTGEFKFCPNCGSKLPESAPEGRVIKKKSGEQKSDGGTVRCPICGFENPMGTRACDSCGSFLGGGSAEQVDVSHAAPRAEHTSAPKEASRKQVVPKKDVKRSPKRTAENKTPQPKKFHLETYQTVAIVAALLLGAIFIYGLMTSRTHTQPSGGGGMPSQQTSSGGQPSANVLHEINRLREVVGKEPDNLSSLLELANMLEDNGFYNQSTVYYKRYLAKVPRNVDARVDYGVTLFQAGNAQDGISQIKEALKTDPTHQKGLFNLGIIYLNTGQIEKANAAFKKCAKVNPNSEVGKKAEQILQEHQNITSQEVN